jgi:hypothetical protein
VSRKKERKAISLFPMVQGPSRSRRRFPRFRKKCPRETGNGGKIAELVPAVYLLEQA